MSNRSLIEFNHDFSHAIEGDQAGFVEALGGYLRSASPRNAAALERFGVTIFGMRHHSDGFEIHWGGHHASEPRSRSTPITRPISSAT